MTMIQRMAWWPTAAVDAETWWNACESCGRNRGKALKGLAREMVNEPDGPDCLSGLPLETVAVDVEDPFTPVSKNGARYILSYRCKVIRASLMRTMTRLSRPT